MSKFIGNMVRLRNNQIRGPIKERETTGPYVLTDGRISWGAEGYAFSMVKPDDFDIVEVVDDPAKGCVGPDEPGLVGPKGVRMPFSFSNTGEIQLLDVLPSHGRIYLAGPMTGYPDLNYPAFHRAAKALRDLGYEVYNPAEYEANEADEFPLREAFTEYANYILNRADIIALLPGHENSVGATAELSLARVVKLKEIYL